MSTVCEPGLATGATVPVVASGGAEGDGMEGGGSAGGSVGNGRAERSIEGDLSFSF